MGSRQINEKALAMLRCLPRVTLANLRDQGKRITRKRGRAQHGGDNHGEGACGRNYYSPLGFESGNKEFFRRFQREYYYKDIHLKREYPPLSLHTLQQMVDTNRIDITKPIDLAAITRTGLYYFEPDERQFGINLTDEGVANFQAKINIEVQWASEAVIAAIERNGGVITTAYFDMHALHALKDPLKFFNTGHPILRRMIPPADAMEYYTDPSKRGYLADPEKVSQERLILAQKYGYELPKIEDDPQYEMLIVRKDPRQIFYGLDPGWVVNLRNKTILKPKSRHLVEFYAS